MLALRHCRPSPSSARLLRSFATTTILPDKEYPRSPSLGDISHDGTDAFNQKQKGFRDGLEAQKKAKEKADSQYLRAPASKSSTSPPIAQPKDAASSTDHESLFDTLGLGSLSTHSGEARQAEHEADGKGKGRLSSLIYGTPEGRQMDKDMERSFSQVLARGKYVHSIVFHQVKPKKVDEYVDLVGKWYPRMASMEENKVNLVGSWRTEVGECDTFGLPHISLWSSNTSSNMT